MARLKEGPAPMQDDPENLAKMVDAINKFGVYALAKYGKVSHTKIYSYMKGKPASEAIEKAILASIKLAVEDREKAREQSRDEANQVLSKV